MPTPSFHLAARWAPQYFSYVAIVGASLLGLVCPAVAPVVLAPLVVVGLIGLGLAHGACDQLVLPALTPARSHPGRQMLLFLVSYLSLAAVAGLGWWYWPAGAVATFFGLTVWHWGSADAPAQAGQRWLWLAHSVLRGTLLFAVPVRWWPTETLHSVNGLLAFAGASPVPAAQFAVLAGWLGPLVVAGHVALWSCYAQQQKFKHALTDVVEVGLLTGLFVVLPPLLALGVYFVFWHSLQHALRLNRLFGYTASPERSPVWAVLGRELLFFLKRAFPLLVVSLVCLVGLYLLLPVQRLSGGDTWLSFLLVMAAVLTLPHALLVSLVMDAAKWRRPEWKTHAG